QGQQLPEQHRAEGAEHEQRAMGEVDDAQSAEHQGQAERDERVGGTFVQPVNKLQEDNFEHHVLLSSWQAFRATKRGANSEARPRSKKVCREAAKGDARSNAWSGQAC